MPSLRILRILRRDIMVLTTFFEFLDFFEASLSLFLNLELTRNNFLWNSLIKIQHINCQRHQKMKMKKRGFWENMKNIFLFYQQESIMLVWESLFCVKKIIFGFWWWLFKDKRLADTSSTWHEYWRIFSHNSHFHILSIWSLNQIYFNVLAIPMIIL